jgi:hypothetical protein
MPPLRLHISASLLVSMRKFLEIFPRVDNADEWHAFCEACYRGDTLRYHRSGQRIFSRRILQQFHSVKVLQRWKKSNVRTM